METARLKKILEKIGNARIGVIGDYCLDAYWHLDPNQHQLSVETGKLTHAVKSQAYSLGGAGNVVKNLVDLGVGEVFAFAVLGDDLFGREILNLLRRDIVNTEGIIVQAGNWQTSVYAKPYLEDEEQQRIDFGRYNNLTTNSENRLVSSLDRHLKDLDALIVNQQLPKGIYTGSIVVALNSFAAKFPSKLFVVNSRSQSKRFSGYIYRLNAVEAARFCGEEKEVTEGVAEEGLKSYARKIFQYNFNPVFISRGANGIYAFDGKNDIMVPGIQILRQVDTVGAGDTGVASMTAALCGGATIAEAAEISNFAAAVTVQKLRQTGTASQSEILEIGNEPDYVYNTELADDVRKARYHDAAEIEIINPKISKGKISHIIFDHDGTISCLRQGWENIMEPMMIKAVLGSEMDSADTDAYQRVVRRVRDYINRSTGIETILQMEMLVEMVKEFGFVATIEVLEAAGYKKIYNDELMKMVQLRVEKLNRKEIDVSDLTVKGVVPFLTELYNRGIKLYMASGTDIHDVIDEATALGYAGLFEGRIFGYTGDMKKMSKKIVVDNIIFQNNLSGSQLAVFGDGPVELREVKKKNGIVIGVASDEIRRFGFNMSKRERLIKAGADLLIPDYTQGQMLLDILFKS